MDDSVGVNVLVFEDDVSRGRCKGIFEDRGDNGGYFGEDVLARTDVIQCLVEICVECSMCGVIVLGRTFGNWKEDHW